MKANDNQRKDVNRKSLFVSSSKTSKKRNEEITNKFCVLFFFKYRVKIEKAIDLLRNVALSRFQKKNVFHA